MLISEANIQVPFSLTVSRILNSSCESLLVSELIYLKTSEDCELRTTVSDFMAGNCLYVCEGSKDEGANSIAMTHTLNNLLIAQQENPHSSKHRISNCSFEESGVFWNVSQVFVVPRAKSSSTSNPNAPPPPPMAMYSSVDIITKLFMAVHGK
mmetsp:Transcript_58811/g.80264  ORF Transcript_58811/g.80264 Transcript_58811/m.80264 type:complete len:153 (-) Transcript_58811:876-1334(-)